VIEKIAQNGSSCQLAGEAGISGINSAAPVVCGRPKRSQIGRAAGDHPGRLRSEAAWGHLCAAAPIPASSGKVTRHRLNPGGDRQANHALWRIVFTRLGSDPATRAYAERRTAEGKSKAEIIRCLKRYVAREVYPHLRPADG
jgi:Transposase IS116/IS110/IS902 family